MKKYRLQQKPSPFPNDGMISNGFIIFIQAKLAVESKFCLTQSNLKTDELPQCRLEHIIQQKSSMRKAQQQGNHSLW